MTQQLHKPFRITVLISGRGSNLQALYQFAQAQELPVAFPLVVSDIASAKGLDFARAQGIPTEVVPRQAKQRTNAEFNTALADTVAQSAPDLVVLAGFMRILTPEFITRFPGRIINIHPSLLPSFKGLHAQQQALETGVRFAGCSVHLVTEEVDGGPVIAQAVVPVLDHDTEDSLSARILRREHRLLPAVVRAIALGEIEVVPKEGSYKVIFKKPLSASHDEDALESIRPD